MSSRTDIFDAIVNDMRANTALFALLGPATSENFRLYRSSKGVSRCVVFVWQR